MLFAGTDSHVGFIAGRYRDGAYSDSWTDVTRCAERTFVAYAPACECGWRGRTFPPTPAGHLAARRLLVHEHLQPSPRRRLPTLDALLPAGLVTGGLATGG